MKYIVKTENNEKTEKNEWGGARQGAGRTPTGRKKYNFFITEEENIKVRKFIEEMRK